MLALVAAAPVLDGGSSAAGEPAAAPSVAELRARGAAASSARKYEECIEAYSAVYAREPSAGTAGELGLCEEAIAHNVAGHDHLLIALTGEVPAAPAPVRARWARYRAALLRLEYRVGRVLLLVAPQTAEVFLDGKSIGTQVSGHIVTVTPGEHTWTARLDGRVSDPVTTVAWGGEIRDILIPLFRVPAPPPPPPPPTCGTCGPPLPLPPAPPPRGPCAAADGLPMSVDLCNALRIGWRRMDPTLGLLAGGLLSLGFTPDVGPGFFLGGEAHWRRQEDWGFQVGAEARFVLPTYGGRTLLTKTSIDITLVELAVVPCVRYKWALGCAFVTPGFSLGGGDLYETPEAQGVGPQPLFMFGIGPRLAVDIPVTERFGIRAFADLRFGPLPPTGYKVNGAYEIWSEPKVSGTVGLGVSFR